MISVNPLLQVQNFHQPSRHPKHMVISIKALSSSAKKAITADGLRIKRISLIRRERNCSVGRTIDVIGDGWSFMIIRECFFGARRFEQFKDVLGLPRTTLTGRLRRLTRLGVLRQVAYSEKPLRHEYRLTRSGFDLYPVMLAMMSFGDRWLSAGKPKPLHLLHTRCGKACQALVACSECKTEIHARRVVYRDGPGAGTSLVPDDRKSRRSADPTALERRRPSSVSRTLQLIGDRWSFMIIRAGFFNIRRFDELQISLGIAPNILTDRLGRLVADGIFKRVLYQTSPGRYEYRFTEMGLELFGSMVSMLMWGDQWHSSGEPPLILTHRDCGKDFTPTVICDQCKEPLIAAEMRYLMNYQDPAPENTIQARGGTLIS
jgi:DNA-binding HxlR family transcriptional regulator